MTELYKRICTRSTWINSNKRDRWIPMEKILSFVTVETFLSTDNMGIDMGWTERRNKGLGLKIKGGWVGGVEYLDSIEYGTKLHNEFNNFVNPFFIFELLTDEGKMFFIEHFKQQIQDIIDSEKEKAAAFQRRADNHRNFALSAETHIGEIFNLSK